jgi:hypothetical protein
LSISRLNTLLESPALPASVIRAQETNFRQMLGNIALPPILEAMHTVSGIKPTVQLLIKRLAPHERSLKGWVSITPHFIYGEYKLPWNTQGTNIVLTVTNPNLTNTTANKRIMLLRDVDGETNWLGLLEQLGLWHHNHAEWFFLPPHSQAIWLQWAGEDYANLKSFRL